MQEENGVFNGTRPMMTQEPEPQVNLKAERRRFSVEYITIFYCDRSLNLHRSSVLVVLACSVALGLYLHHYRSPQMQRGLLGQYQ